MNDRTSLSRPPLTLIANSQEWHSRSLESILGPHGYAVLRAYTGKQAIERATSARPDLIILDTDLPDRDGFDVCRELRASGIVSPSTPILITSPGHPSRQKRLDALRAGAWDYIGSALDGEELPLRLDAYLRAKQEVDRAREESLLDELTGLYNIRGLARRARELGSAAFRDKEALACVVIMPVFAVKSGAFFAMTTGILGLMGGLLQINPIWQLGPYKPSHVSAGSQPDFYMMWTEGLARIFPPWEIYIGHHTIPAAFWVAIVMGLVFGLLIAYPFLERKFTGDNAHHNLLQRPRDVPVRTAIGSMAISFYMLLTLCAMNDVIAFKFHISLNATTWIGRIGMVVLPPIVYFIAYRWAVGLQRSDRDVLEHGIETGIIKRLPHGAYIELHQPLGPVDDHGHPIPLEYGGAALPKRMNKLGSAGQPGRGSFLSADPVSEDAALSEAEHAAEHRALTALRDRQDHNGNGHH